jgi:hypothetical protein
MERRPNTQNLIRKEAKRPKKSKLRKKLRSLRSTE